MIGFFDSGVGGLTVLQSVHKRLPQYATIYFGDQAHAPFGDKTHDQITEYTWAGVEWLFAQGCTLVILACNSASAQALRIIQQTKLQAYPGRRVLGVIRPTVEALAHDGAKRVAIFSTLATEKSHAYIHEFHKLAPHMYVYGQACEQWATLIEQGKANTQEMYDDIHKELSRLEQTHPSTEAILLGCTHYPLIADRIAEQTAIPIFEQGEIIAASLEAYLQRHPEIETSLEKDGERQYFTTGDVEQMNHISERFGFPVHWQHVSL